MSFTGFEFSNIFIETFSFNSLLRITCHWRSVSVTFPPPRLYLHKDGLVRFATECYDDEGANLKNPFVHLTNYAVNRTNQENQEEKGMHDFRILLIATVLEDNT